MHYFDRIEEISKKIQIPRLQNLSLDIAEYLKDLNFAKYEFSDLGISWLDNLIIYICNNANFCDAGALVDSSCSNFFKKDDNGNFKFATIYIVNDGSADICGILLHELKHIYDKTKLKKIFMEDSEYYMSRIGMYDILKYDFDTDVRSLDKEDVHNILTECMYYSNFTETHAFMENINFDIYRFFSSKNQVALLFHEAEEVFNRCSSYVLDISVLDYLVESLMTLDEAVKKKFFDAYKDDYKKVMIGKCNKLDDMLKIYHKRFKKVLSHSKQLFNYYYMKSQFRNSKPIEEGKKYIGDYILPKRAPF